MLIQCYGDEDAVQVFFGEDAHVEHDLADGLAGAVALLGDLGCGAVAYVRVEGRCEAHAVLDQLPAALFVGGDALHGVFHEDVNGVLQDVYTHQHVEGHHGHHDVELELAGLHRHGYSRIVADHLEAGHVEHL